jgi:hypothetical protein
MRWKLLLILQTIRPASAEPIVLHDEFLSMSFPTPRSESETTAEQRRASTGRQRRWLWWDLQGSGGPKLQADL